MVYVVTFECSDDMVVCGVMSSHELAVECIRKNIEYYGQTVIGEPGLCTVTVNNGAYEITRFRLDVIC